MLPTGPVVLGAAILDGGDGEAVAEVGEIVDHAGGVEGLAFADQGVGAVAEELGAGAVDGEGDVLAGSVAGGLAGAADEGQRVLGGAEIGSEAAFVADVGAVAGIVQRLFQRMEDLRAHADAFGQGGRADGLDHEFLHVDRVVGVLAAVDDVHHRDRQGAGEGAADIAVERLAEVVGGGLGQREGDGEDGIGAEAGLVRRAVEVDHDAVELDLFGGVHAADGVEDFALDVGAGLGDALAAVAGRIAVA